jgi:hypothetical protein
VNSRTEMLLMSNWPHSLFPERVGQLSLSLSLSEVWSTWIQAESVLRLEQQRPTRIQAEVVLRLEHKVQSDSEV